MRQFVADWPFWQLSGESSCAVMLCLYWCYNMHCRSHRNPSHSTKCTHAHRHSHCRDPMLLGNVFKTMGKCNWFSADSKVRGLGSTLGSPLFLSSSPRVALSCRLCSRLNVCIVNISKWRRTEACTSRHTTLLARATKESKELFSLEDLGISPLLEPFYSGLFPETLSLCFTKRIDITVLVNVH